MGKQVGLEEARAAALNAFNAVVEERRAIETRHRKARKEIGAAESIADVKRMSEDARNHWQFIADISRGFSAWPFELQKKEVLEYQAPRGPKELSEYVAAARILFDWWLSQPGAGPIAAVPFANRRSETFNVSKEVQFLHDEFARLAPVTGIEHETHAYTVASKFRGLSVPTELKKVT